MHEAINHVSAVELEQGLHEVLSSPRDVGQLEAIVVRPAANERSALRFARLTPEGGIDGDRWVNDSYYRTKDGGSDPRSQVSLMNARFLRQIAGDEVAMCLAGDNLIVDFDLGAENVPPGTQLSIGDEVVIEVNDLPHTGCSKLARRYGDEARAFMNSPKRKELHLRGRYASIVRGGTIKVGDVVAKRPRQ
jgi:MOSC domain-containing protein YiiM